jgi:hypothetical protein
MKIHDFCMKYQHKIKYHAVYRAAEKQIMRRFKFFSSSREIR